MEVTASQLFKFSSEVERTIFCDLLSHYREKSQGMFGSLVFAPCSSVDSPFDVGIGCPGRLVPFLSGLAVGVAYTVEKSRGGSVPILGGSIILPPPTSKT